MPSAFLVSIVQFLISFVHHGLAAWIESNTMNNRIATEVLIFPLINDMFVWVHFNLDRNMRIKRYENSEYCGSGNYYADDWISV